MSLISTGSISLDSTFKGTVRPDQICSRVVPLKRPIVRTFLVFNFKFDLDFLEEVQSFNALKTIIYFITMALEDSRCEILFFYWLAKIQLMKKSAKVLC